MMMILRIPLFVLLACYLSAGAQVPCSQVDLNQVTPQWVWRKAGYGTQWTRADQIRQELQRILPQPPAGLQATFSIFAGMNPAIPDQASPKFYQPYLMLKKFECVRSLNNKVQPEGETGCWIYFTMNTLNPQPGIHSLPGLADGAFWPGTEGPLYITRLWLEKDAAGNRILYSSRNPESIEREGYLIAAGDRLPVRTLSQREVIACYRARQEKDQRVKRSSLESGLATNRKDLNGYARKNPEDFAYVSRLIAEKEAALAQLKKEEADLLAWCDRLSKKPGAEKTAYLTNPFISRENLETMTTDSAAGYPVWVDDPGYFDRKKPADQPQFIFLSIRRQDADLPKKAFMDRFFSAFNLDVLYRMIQAAPPAYKGLNCLDASLMAAKATTAAQQTSRSRTWKAAEATTGRFPENWRGMKNIAVEKGPFGSALALRQNGYWFPRQFNQEIGDGFSLNFDLSWPADISYYSELFCVTFCEIAYDNNREEYRMDDNQRNYWSFYDSYAGEFNRVTLWFDPYFNDGGSVELQVHNNRDTRLLTKKLVLKDFYRSKNKHRLQLERSGQRLIVKDNGQVIADWEGVFQPSVRYNLFAFSRYRSNNSVPATDQFFLDDLNWLY